MKSIFLIIIVIFLISCNVSDRKTQNARERFKGFEDIIPNVEIIKEIKPDINTSITINIPEYTKYKPLLLDELIDSIYYIKLETSDLVSLEAIDKVLFIEDKIVVYDKKKKRGLYLFSDKGKFLTRIGNFGKGPKEYLGINDVAINKTKKNIVLLDDYGKSIIYYDFNGKFIKRNKLYYYSTDISILDDGSFVFFQMEGINAHLTDFKNYCLLLSNENQSVTNYAFPYSYRANFPLLTFGRVSELICSNETTLFNPYLSNYIYQIKSSNQIALKYKLDLGDTDILSQINKETNNEDYIKMINSNKYIHFDGEMLETNQNLYFKYGNNNYGFYNIKTNNLLCGNSFSYIVQDNSPYVLFNFPTAVKNNWFVSIIWPYELSKHQKELIDKSTDSTYEIFKCINPQDNPILMFFKVKEF